MTEYEISSYEAFRRKYQDDVRPVQRASVQTLDTSLLEKYLLKLKEDRPNLAKLDSTQIYELMSITKDGVPTLSAVMLFSQYPQAYFPQLCITAVSVPGLEIGQLGAEGERFLDNQRSDGTLTQMLEGALAFMRKNMRTKTIIDPETGKRSDRSDYPIAAIREAVLNALVHRDYSIHTEGMPIQLLLFEDRFELKSPGGLYGRLRVDQLGKVQPDTRNPVLAVAMEVLDETENRYSGIPTMRRELAQAGMQPPEFRDERGSFVVCFLKAGEENVQVGNVINDSFQDYDTMEKNLLRFCAVSRTRQEIAEFLKIKSVPYAIKAHVNPLVERGLIRLSPCPRSQEVPSNAIPPHSRNSNKRASRRGGRLVYCALQMQTGGYIIREYFQYGLSFIIVGKRRFSPVICASVKPVNHSPRSLRFSLMLWQ